MKKKVKYSLCLLPAMVGIVAVASLLYFRKVFEDLNVMNETIWDDEDY